MKLSWSSSISVIGWSGFCPSIRGHVPVWSLKRGLWRAGRSHVHRAQHPAMLPPTLVFLFQLILDMWLQIRSYGRLVVWSIYCTLHDIHVMMWTTNLIWQLTNCLVLPYHYLCLIETSARDLIKDKSRGWLIKFKLQLVLWSFINHCLFLTDC